MLPLLTTNFFAAEMRSGRRQFLGAIGLAALTVSTPGLAQDSAKAEKIPTDDLMVANALTDVVLGGADAKVTVIEYASMTCTHCARFHEEVYPAFKAKYIDTNKIKFILREFPLDPLATAGFMLARCTGTDDKRTALVDLMFTKQKDWAFVDKPVEALLNLSKQAGFTQDSFEACLKNQDLYDGVNKVRDRASEKFGVDATPTFFINGLRKSGEVSLDDMDKVLEPLLRAP
jgi:protein-disulfide isomerase